MQNMWSTISGILFILGYIPYVTAILRKQTRPTKATWFIFVGLDYITITGMYMKHEVTGQILGAVIGGTLVVVLALKYGDPGLTELEKVVLGIGVIGAGLLVFDPRFGIVASLVAMFIGALPTFINTWKDQTRESKTSWLFWWLSCFAGLAGITEWSIASAAAIITFTMIESTMMFILFIHHPPVPTLNQTR